MAGEFDKAAADAASEDESRRDLVRIARAQKSASEWRANALALQRELDLAEQRIAALTDLQGQTNQKPLRIEPRKKSASGEVAAVALASDWHPEEKVSLGATNGLNEHNLAIADRKIRLYFEHVLRLIDHSREGNEVNVLVLALLGDFMSGHIHEDLVEVTELSPTETILWVQERIDAGIRLLLERANLRRLVIPCCIGNHGRTTMKPRISTAIKHSYEWLMYQQLRQTFRNEKGVEFVIAEGYHLILDVFGMVHRYHHGDAVRGNGGIGGITIPVNKAIGQWDKAIRADHDFMGHHHQEILLPKAALNGSLIGWNPFGNWIKAAFERPSQTFCLFSAERKRRTATFPIFLDGKK